MFSDETVTRQRPVHAEYLAMGFDPKTVRLSVQLQMPLLCLAGLVAALAGGLLTLRLTAALVSVTATSGRPLPPIVAVVHWTGAGAMLVAVAVLAIAGAWAITANALRDSPAGDLRA
ncbi:MAG: FtsX-like permease family protein [Streptosporangiaceae bacterium]